MKKILLILSLICLSCHAYAAEITCFSENGQIAYHHMTDDVKISEGFYIFHEKSTGKLVYISGDCVVKYHHK